MKNNMILNLIVNFLILYQINGLPLSKNTPYKRNKPYEQHNLFEGDIRLPPSTLRGVFERGDTVAWRNGIVPYEIAPGYESEQEQFIISTMRRMENSLAVNGVLCVHFRPKTSDDRYYITIRNGNGCSSYVGQYPSMTSEHTVTLQHPGCIYEGIIMHELLHTLGFYHEQSRPDRDSYVKVHVENVGSGMEYNFNKHDDSSVDTRNVPYDYGSVMHYDKYAFSSNGLPTIEPIEPGVEIGQNIWMSPIDMAEVRLFYNCSSSEFTLPTIPTTTVSNYSSALTTNHEMYIRPGSTILDYYEEIQITVDRAGIYFITSVGDMEILGCLYDGAFNPSNPSWNPSWNPYKVDYEGNSQFKLTAYLLAGAPYTLLVFIYGYSLTRPFSIVATGPGNVQYIPMNPTVTTTSYNGVMAVNLTDAANSGKAVYIRSALGNSYLHVHGGEAFNGAPITVWEYADQENLKWFINTIDQGFYIQSAVNPSFVIHQEGFSFGNGDNITLYDKTIYGHQDNMKVNFLSNGHGFYFIQFVHSKKCIQVDNALTTNGNRVSQWSIIHQSNVLWDFYWA